MGASGKQLKGHGARHKTRSPAASVKDNGYGLPAHPLVLRVGMRFFARAGTRRVPIELTRVPASDGPVEGRKLDDARHPVRLSRERLLATDALRHDGQGRHYQFLGWRPERRYATFAYVHALDGSRATLCVPEWHPRRPVTFFASLVPQAARAPGAWIACTAILAAPSAARLNLAELVASPAPPPGALPAPNLLVR